MDRHAVAAAVLDAAQVQDLGAAGRQLEHLLVGDRVEAAGVGHDARVGGEDAVDIGVDLADVGIHRGGERDGGRVGAAAAERGDVLGVRADALEAGDDRDVARDRAPTRIRRRDVDDARLAVHRLVMTPACEPVNERAWKPRELIAIASTPSRCVRRRSAACRARAAGGAGSICFARSSSSSVVSPIADTTTTTS